MQESPIKSLTDNKKRALKKWRRKTTLFFITFMAFIVIGSMYNAIVETIDPILRIPKIVYVPLGVLGIITVTLVHLQGKCPNCGFRIFFYSPNILPEWCLKCGISFK